MGPYTHDTEILVRSIVWDTLREMAREDRPGLAWLIKDDLIDLQLSFDGRQLYIQAHILGETHIEPPEFSS